MHLKDFKSKNLYLNQNMDLTNSDIFYSSFLENIYFFYRNH